ncbi:hypothetical protein F6Y05_33750 [Bacillus megaterium]|nr:hypothetical protein [Priestia megaterium]
MGRKNRDVIDFSRIQPQILLPEPEWFQAEREADKKTRKKENDFTQKKKMN